MNIPQNFNKISNQTFQIGNAQFRLDIDEQAPGDVWVYCDGYNSNSWPLCFDIDWERETYTLIKCQPGMGRIGDVLANNTPLVRFLMKDLHSFINVFLKDIMGTLINNKII